jgi:hypothetical protein
MMDTEVLVGFGRAERLGRVEYSLGVDEDGGNAVMVGAGLIGMAGILWCVYHTNTALVSPYPHQLRRPVYQTYSCAQTCADHYLPPLQQTSRLEKISWPQAP